MSISPQDAKALADYLHRRLDRLQATNAELESNLDEQKRELCEQVDAGICDKNDPYLGKTYFHLEFVLGNTFRFTLLSGICTFLEEALKEISKRFVPNHEKELKSAKGNFLAKHIELLTQFGGVDATNIRVDIAKFHDLICLRNCVVHSWGKLAEESNPQRIRDAVSKIESAEISKDDFLVFGDQVVPVAIVTAERIAEHILTSKLGTSMT